MASPFRVALTHDFLSPEGKLVYQDIGLDILDAAPAIERTFLEVHPSPLRPRDVEGLDALISLAPAWTPETLKGVGRLVGVVRFGVGYDMVDVAACTAADVAVAITPGAVNRSMAESILTWMLALSHRVLQKDRLVRESRWAQKTHFMGCELRGRTLGIVGLGGIGRSLVDLVRGLGMTPPLAFDPLGNLSEAAALGVSLVPLDELLRRSDFVSINCPLNAQTRGLIGRDQLSLMKREAFLINTARGGIVDERALVDALRAGRISGAGIDVFEGEPADGSHPLASLENVILAPHAIGWTHELFRDIGRAACTAVVSLSRGEIPAGIVNPEVLRRPGFLEKLRSRGAISAEKRG
jgi:phosphoglycerate dehydrogenase-like enzyme